ncbi:MAG: hypothetical protein HYT10_00305 [Candidatus Levybacteria bacterium]|nr:hypothetical protein [Candidatus Levybacteria bacterium]
MDDQNIKAAEDGISEEPANTDSKATILLSLEEMVKTTIGSLEKAATELREQKQMFADTFLNDPVFREQEQKVKEANKVKQGTKQEIIKQPQVLRIAEKIKSLSGELREKKASLSDYLLEYQRLTGAHEIEGPNGQLLEIINDAKVIKRSSK